MKFRKKPVVIEAVYWDETLFTLNLLKSLGLETASYISHVDNPEYIGMLGISTLEGVMSASKGDWIIKGVKGEFYPCNPDIFEAIYEAV